MSRSSRNKKKKNLTKTRNKSASIDIVNPPFHHDPHNPTVNTPAVRGTHTTTTFAAEFSSGPIPTPDRLAQYDAVLPGAADRIIKMAENQSAHRQDLESKVVTADINRAYLGVACGLIVTIFAFALGGYLIMHDHDWAGATIIITDLAVLVGVFIYGTQARKQQLQNKKEPSNQLVKRQR